MKWLPLKIYQADKLIPEIEAVESKYDNMINLVRCAEENEEQIKIDFLTFREEIELRIIELDEFYQLNITDSRISQFEKIRNRLASLLEINIDEGNQIVRKNYGNNLNSNTNSLNFNKKLTPSKQGTASMKKSKLLMSSSVMRHSSVRGTSSKFGE